MSTRPLPRSLRATALRVPAQPAAVLPVLHDDFDDLREPGTVVGSRNATGSCRHGRDVEGRLSIDARGLRIAAPRVPGFGRHVLRYGPCAREPGTVFVAYVLNGHNASQTAYLDERSPAIDLARRLWWRCKNEGRRLIDGVRRTLGASPESASCLPRPPNHFHLPHVRENLAVGFLAENGRPRKGHAFVMRSANHECGTLHVTSCGRLLPVQESVRNVPIAYVVLLRPRGAVYYVSSLSGVPGMPEHPSLRPVAVDPRGDHTSMWPTIDQAILGEINFSVDTRVFGVRAGISTDWAPWYGSAHVADRLDGMGPLAGEPPEAGSRWAVMEGEARRTELGTSADARTWAIVQPTTATGLLHLDISAPSGAGSAGLVLRASRSGSAIVVAVGPEGARVERLGGDGVEVLWADASIRLRRGQAHSLQVRDDGERIWAALDGRPLLTRPLELGAYPNGTAVGVFADGRGEVRFRDFEAHPRELVLDPALQVASPWWVPPRTEPRLTDDFAGPEGELASNAGPPSPRWERTLGDGHIDRTGGGEARVRAKPDAPNPGRTFYTVPCDDPSLGDVEVEITPPGAQKGEGELTRGGLVLWQDAENYLVVNAWNDDLFPGASVSSFLVSGGREDLYRAVWTNVGDAVRRGVPLRLRLVSDGLHYLVLLNDEPILHRAITDIDPTAAPLRIERVGIAANWEFGDDTGTVFRAFVARGRRRP